jgi:hypothetical protein
MAKGSENFEAICWFAGEVKKTLEPMISEGLCSAEEICLGLRMAARSFELEYRAGHAGPWYQQIWRKPPRPEERKPVHRCRMDGRA